MNRATTAGTALADRAAGEQHAADSPATVSTTAAIARAAARMRSAERCTCDRVAAALGHTAERWRKREFAPRRETVAGLASALGMTPALLDESLDALLEPVTAAALKSLAAKLPVADRLFGFLMPGNVPGAGIHEVCAALLAGAGLIIKSASSEPLFFANFMRTLAEVDATVAARVAVVNFGRGDDAAMRELWAACDGGVVAYGDDASIAALSAAAARGARPLAGFGSRLSGALVVPGRVRPPPRRRRTDSPATSRCSSSADVSRRITCSWWATRARRAASPRASPARWSAWRAGCRRRRGSRWTPPRQSGRCASARDGARSRSARAAIAVTTSRYGRAGASCHRPARRRRE